MTDETREKLKDLGKKRALQTAILTTPEYDRGRRDGYNDAIAAAKTAINELFNELGYDVSRMPQTPILIKLETLKKSITKLR